MMGDPFVNEIQKSSNMTDLLGPKNPLALFV